MLKPTRTILALAAGSLVLGLVGAGVAVADENPVVETPSQAAVTGVAASQAAAYDRYVVGKVVSRGPLKVRSEPTTRARIVGQVQPNRKVEIECKKYGQAVDGNRLWYRLHEKDNGRENEQDNGRENGQENGQDSGDWGNGGRENGSDVDDRARYERERWVSARYVQNLGTVKYCR
ncbi:SH3 domain-containing protein [Streptomyces sp. NPDC058662]|uniref:SH3 domain-containing protein n=1 Tax=Streptomyces sp. NPDC058662 TaxID=3346583 RepID=UPI00365A434E